MATRGTSREARVMHCATRRRHSCQARRTDKHYRRPAEHNDARNISINCSSIARSAYDQMRQIGVL